MTQNQNTTQGRSYDDAAVDRLFDATVHGADGEKLGSVGQVYLNDATNQPEWVTVKTGLFGTKESFVPLRDARVSGDRIDVPFSKDVVKDAPNIDPDKHIDESEQAELYRYYSRQGVGGTQGRDAREADGRDAAAAGVAGGAADRDVRGEADRGEYDANRRADADRGAAGRSGDDSLVAHEERLNVGTEQAEAGRVKLRKRVVTENQKVDVPVQREELVVEREQLGGEQGRATDHTIGESVERDEDIVLHEERPVVSKETVATEQVNVGKQTVTENQTVSEQVRKEQIEVEGDGVEERDARR